MIYDIAIVGGGPAGLAAALNARRRNKETILIGKEAISSKLEQAHLIDNYLGLPQITGMELAQKMLEHAKTNGIVIVKDEIQTIYQDDQIFNLFGRENSIQAKTVILTTGVSLSSEIEGESELIGRGVSYCATCDGMFFKGKPVAMIGYIREAEAEVNFLAEISPEVFYLPLYKNPGKLDDRVKIIQGKPLSIKGSERVEAIRTTAGEWLVDGIFIERAGKPGSQLIEGLHLEGEYIKVDSEQATNIPGIFAAGDCTGKPWQIARAVGQGQVAALSAIHYLDSSNN